MNKRLLAVLLCLVLIVGLMPFGAFAVSDSETAAVATETTAAADQANADLTYLAFTSDVHNGTSSANSANRLGTWLKNVTNKIGDTIDVMNFCGDFGSASAQEAQYWTYAQAVLDAADNSGVVKDKVYTTGNHEFMNGQYGRTSNSVKNGFTRLGQARNTSNYIIYAFGVHDWDNYSDHYDTGDISTLDSYLGSLSAADQAKPIFILTHFPIHRFQSRSTSNADQVVNVLNKYSEKGYDIYYLWGHNHTVADTHYDEVFTGSLDGTAIKFTYLAAGCMADSEYGQSAAVKGKGLVIGIDGTEVKSMTYYDVNANDVTEHGGVAPTVAPTSAPSGTTPVSGKQYLIICDGYALTTAPGESYSNGENTAYSYTGLAGKSYSSGMTVTTDMVWTFTSSGNGYLISNDGKYLNGTYESGSNSGKGALKLDSTQDVWTLSGNTLKSTNASSTASSDKYLAHGNGTQSNPNTFSMRSAPSNNNSNVVNTLTFIEVSNGQAVEPSTQPTTTPSGTTSSVSVTPSTDNPSVNATINVGDTLTINVTNGSTNSSYNFSASVANTSIAQVQGSSSVSIGKSSSGTITVKGLAAGTTDITIQNDQSYSQYVRKAVIHLTVVSGGTQPTTQPTTQPGTDTQISVTPVRENSPEVSATIKVGDTLSIKVTNSSEYSDYDFTATLSNSGVAQLASSVVNIKQGGTGTFTVTGLKAGTVDIKISNSNSYDSSYNRVATIHLTVVSGTTPTVAPTVEPTVAPTVAPCTHPQTAVSGKKAATCTEAGYTGDVVCLKCGEIVTKGEVIPAKGHETVLQGKKDATCTEAGYTGDYVCTVCGAVVAKGNEIEALGHDTVVRNAKEATCETAGYTGDTVCKVCGETVKKGEVIPALGHDWDDGSVTKAATCTEDGVMTFVCKHDASHTKTEVIAAKGHSWGEWVVTTPATEQIEGVETRTCSVCGATETRAIPVLTHVHVLTKVEAKAPTCTEAGFEAYWQCEGCHKLFSDAEGKTEIEAPVAVAALGHTWGDWVETKAATETEEGVETRTCSVCGETETRAIPVIAHVHELVAVAAVPATETAPGTEAYWKCEGCGKLFSDAEGKNEIAAPVVIPALECPSKVLTDVDRSAKSWYHEAVDWAFVNNITKGTSATEFSPMAECTREQMVTFLWRALGEPKTTLTSCPFTDVVAKDYSYTAILWAYENGIVKGTAADKFSPKAPVTREQVVTILWRLAEQPETAGDMPFPDVKAGYAFDAIKWAAANNVTTGYPDGTFAPTKTVTRAEIVTLLYRYFNK